MVGSDGPCDSGPTGPDCCDGGSSCAMFEDDAETREAGVEGEEGGEEGLFGGEDGGRVLGLEVVVVLWGRRGDFAVQIED